MRYAGLYRAFIAGGLVACGAGVYAAEPSNTKQEAPPEALTAQVAQDPVPGPEELERQRLATEAHEKLEGTVWKLDFKSYRSAKEAKPFTDELTFQGGLVSSKRFGDAGYAPSMYSINLQGRTPLWETMQRKDDEGTMTWSGELYDQSMTGVVTKRSSDPDAQPEHFQFTGTLVGQVPAAPEQEAAP